MDGYLGEVDVSKDYDTSDKAEMALLYILMYGGIDGAHHKDWVLDQVARILNGADIKVSEARWDNGHKELRYQVGPCKQYEDWVAKCRSGEDGPYTYDYDEGIAP